MAVLGVDIGGTKLLALLTDDEGHRLWSASRGTGRSFGPAVASDAIANLVAEAPTTPDVIGVGIPGLVTRRGHVLSSVMLDGWNSEAFADRVTKRLGTSCLVSNDVNNAARAEARLRSDQASFLYASVGTGIGGALVLDGEVWSGAGGLAGEVGHISVGGSNPCPCGRTGCVGSVAGGGALERQLGGPIEECALDTHGNLREPVLRAARCLGGALAAAMHFLNLDLIVLGGGVAQLGEAYRAAVEAEFRTVTMTEIHTACRVERSVAGYEAAAIGASLLALEGLRDLARR